MIFSRLFSKRYQGTNENGGALFEGAAGLEYLRKGFADSYGSPPDTRTTLPMILWWFSPIWTCKDYECNFCLFILSCFQVMVNLDFVVE